MKLPGHERPELADFLTQTESSVLRENPLFEPARDIPLTISEACFTTLAQLKTEIWNDEVPYENMARVVLISGSLAGLYPQRQAELVLSEDLRAYALDPVVFTAQAANAQLSYVQSLKLADPALFDANRTELHKIARTAAPKVVRVPRPGKFRRVDQDLISAGRMTLIDPSFRKKKFLRWIEDNYFNTGPELAKAMHDPDWKPWELAGLRLFAPKTYQREVEPSLTTSVFQTFVQTTAEQIQKDLRRNKPSIFGVSEKLQALYGLAVVAAGRIEITNETIRLLSVDQPMSADDNVPLPEILRSEFHELRD